MPTPPTLVDTLLQLNPAAWPGRREEAHAVLSEWLNLATSGQNLLPLLPDWLTQELPKTFPPE